MYDANLGSLGAFDTSPQGWANFQQTKPKADAYRRESNFLGRDPANAQGLNYSSNVVFDPTMGQGQGGLKIMGNNGTHYTSAMLDSGDGSAFAALDRFGVDPASYQSAVQQLLANGNSYAGLPDAIKQNYINSSGQYVPRTGEGWNSGVTGMQDQRAALAANAANPSSNQALNGGNQSMGGLSAAPVVAATEAAL